MNVRNVFHESYFWCFTKFEGVIRVFVFRVSSCAEKQNPLTTGKGYNSAKNSQTMIAFRNYPLLASLLILPSAFALQCGQTLTTPCLGATDIRYNAEASNDVTDQAEGTLVCVPVPPISRRYKLVTMPAVYAIYVHVYQLIGLLSHLIYRTL